MQQQAAQQQAQAAPANPTATPTSPLLNNTNNPTPQL
jgi:hypothetical protein